MHFLVGQPTVGRRSVPLCSVARPSPPLRSRPPNCPYFLVGSARARLVPGVRAFGRSLAGQRLSAQRRLRGLVGSGAVAADGAASIRCSTACTECSSTARCPECNSFAGTLVASALTVPVCCQFSDVPSARRPFNAVFI